MNYKLKFPNHLQTQQKQGKLEVYLNEKNELTHIQPIIFEPIRGRFHLIFIPSAQLFKNFDNHLKIPSIKKKAICFNLKGCKIYHRMYLGYFMIEQYHSFLQIDFLQGNIIKSTNKGYLVIQNDQLSVSDQLIPWNMLFYRFQGSKISFYKGHINYKEKKDELYFKQQGGIIKIFREKANIQLGYELINQNKFYFIDEIQSKYFYFTNQFILSDSKEELQVLNYQQIKLTLPFRYFGLDDNSNNIFKLSGDNLFYNVGDQIQIQPGSTHQLRLFLNGVQIKLLLKDGKLIKDNQGHKIYILLISQLLFSLQFANGKYLKYQEGKFFQSIEKYIFRNKPNGFYIFHTEQNYKCLSIFQNSIQNRFIDPQYALYFSIEDKVFYIDNKRVYIDDMYKIVFYEANSFQIEFQQDQIFIYCKISGNKKYLAYVPSYQTFKFSAFKQTAFYYSNVKDLEFNFDIFYQISFKNLYLNKNSYLFQTIEVSQRFKDIWQVYGRDFISLKTYTINGSVIFGVFNNQNQLDGRPYFYHESWLFKLENIIQKIPNLYECDLNFETYVYSQQNLIGKVKKNGNYLSTQGEDLKIHFHKIPCKIKLPTQFTIDGIGADVRFLKGPFWTKFREIDKNIYVLSFPNNAEYNVVFQGFYWRLWKTGSNYQKTITFSIQNFDGNHIYLKIRTWKAMNGQSFLYNPNTGNQTIVAQIPWLLNLHFDDV